jgi:hypothetical protein
MNCEQMYPLAELHVSNPYALYCMQSSNINEEMLGINTVANAEALASQLELDTVLYKGTKNQTIYTWRGKEHFQRFQVIGTKVPAKKELPEVKPVDAGFLAKLKGRFFTSGT